MNVLKTLWASVQGDPSFQRKLHGGLTIAWLAASIPICIWLNDSIPFLVFISVYAVVTGHWSAFQAAQVEVKQDEIEEKREEES